MRAIARESIKEVVSALQTGGTVIFPTETSYGLGCDATNQIAADKIFAIKGRPGDKPLLVVVPSIAMAQELLKWSDLLERLSARYWPGPLTIIGPFKGPGSRYQLAKGVVGADDTVAVRVTADPWLQKITAALGQPLVATSANLADAGDQYDPRAIEHMFTGRAIQPDFLIDGGLLPKRLPTTVLSVLNDKCRVVRQGEVHIDNVSFL